MEADLLKVIATLLLAIVGWYIWSLKQSFLTKKEFKEYREKHNREHKELEVKIAKQSEDIVEIKTYIKSISESIHDIKNYLFSIKRKD